MQIKGFSNDSYCGFLLQKQGNEAIIKEMEFSDSCYGFAYDGMLDQETYNQIKSQGVLVWDRSHIKSKSPNEKKEFSVPCIVVRGDKNRIFGFGKQLSQALDGNGYPSLAVSNDIESLFFGYRILEDDSEIEEVAQRFGYSCIVICSDYEYHSDIVLNIENDTCHFQFENEVIGYTYNESIIQEIVKKVENCFEVESETE